MIPNGLYLDKKEEFLDIVLEIDGVKVATSGHPLTVDDSLESVIDYPWHEYESDYVHKIFLDYPVALGYRLIAPEIMIGWVE